MRILAERRMFAKTIVTSDAFLDMPLSARCLYFTLGMFADDDGFVNNPKSIMRQVGASQDDLNLLLVKRFILTFESGVIVIKHWRIHNYIRNDRYKETKYVEEKSTLTLDEKGAYTEMDSVGIPLVDKMDTQVSIGKVSLGKVSLGEGSVVEATTTATEAEEGNQLKLIGGTLGKNVVYLTDNQMANLIDKLGLDAFNRYVGRLADYIIEKNAHIKNHYDTILKWHKEDTSHNTPRHQSVSQNEYKSYDIDDFFEAAMKSSMRELDKY